MVEFKHLINKNIFCLAASRKKESIEDTVADCQISFCISHQYKFRVLFINNTFNITIF